MKVSLCLSGQIRSQTLVRDSIKKYLIDPYDCDVFCHFWHRYDNLKYQNYYNKSDTFSMVLIHQTVLKKL